MFFNPDPYVKIRIEPGQDRSQSALSHHYKDTRTSVCENTTEPRWHNEVSIYCLLVVARFSTPLVSFLNNSVFLTSARCTYWICQ